ncbi:uroporphyrinogen-III synthase [Alicyclobacillus sacchari]|uniref:uroporphyrinogen-III synthase n=1 Tax=Alicyclobacillus sacchari TaxID=392010 RepID=UPI0024E0A3AA|nr:uroporphyrinogen-III synthase [Alicyclobacillus sacchari]
MRSSLWAVRPIRQAAAIEWGTRSRQRSVTGTLASLPALARRVALSSPAVIVVGDVVQSQERLHWFERLPRFGQRILVVAGTNAEALAVAEQLESEGAETCVTTLEQRWRPEREQVEAVAVAAANGSAVGILFRTSLVVSAFWQALQASQTDFRRLSRVRFAALDEAVAAQLRRCGIEPDFTSLGEIARANVDAWWVEDLPYSSVRAELRAAVEAFGGPVRTFVGLKEPFFDGSMEPSTLRHTWTDVLAGWVREGHPDAVHIVGDPNALAPLYTDLLGDVPVMTRTLQVNARPGNRLPYALASEWR